MDNLTIQITPLEVTYQHKDPLPLSCVFKKLVIATNHPLEKYQIKSEPDNAAGKNKFSNGPIFALNKEFQLQNTKISLDFIARKQRGISCIGSAVVDVATLPTQSESVLDLNLSNCIYPHGKTKLHVKRKQESIQNKKNSKGKPQVMGLLQTQSQLKQQLMLNRRTNPNFPTAYEISRKNYKQAETHCHESDITNKKQRSISSKGSYQKRFHANNTDSNTSRLKNVQNKLKDESPRPRQRTPEPILVNNRAKRQKNKTIQAQTSEPKYGNGLVFRQKVKQPQKMKQLEKIEQPQNLKVKPYQSNVQKRSKETDENISSNISCNELQRQKINKYLDVTQKLQKIHEKLMGWQEKKYKTEVFSVSSNKQSQQEVSEFNHNNKLGKDASHQSYSQLGSQKDQNKIKQSSISNKDSPIQITNNSPQDSTSRDMKESFPVRTDNPKPHVTSSGDKNVNKNTRQTSPAQKSEAVISVDMPKCNQKFIQHSNFDAKMQIMQLEGLNIELSKENELLRVKLYDAQETVKKLMNQLSEKIKMRCEKDTEMAKAYREIESLQSKVASFSGKEDQLFKLNRQVEEFKLRVFEQRSVIQKITHDYEEKLDQIVFLEDQLQNLQRSQIPTNQSLRTKNEDIYTAKLDRGYELLKQENAKINSKCLQAETNLKLRQNEIKHLKLEINNILAQKKQLEEQIMVIARGKKEEMARQKSLAHIEQISSTSLAQLTKRENENLKNQVQILQGKIQSLNKILQSLVNKDENTNKNSQSWAQLVKTNDKQRFQSKLKELQQKCSLLEDDLRKKKNQLAEMVNVVFDFADPQLMETVQKIMEI